MSQSSLAAGMGRDEQRAAEPRTIEHDGDVRTILEALDDDACRNILEATSEAARTANELSETCNLPLSTAYRKLELLTGTGLLVERTRVSRAGKHASEYVRAVEEVRVPLGTNGEVEVLTIPEERSGPLASGTGPREP